MSPLRRARGGSRAEGMSCRYCLTLGWSWRHEADILPAVACKPKCTLCCIAGTVPQSKRR